jgi:hypothetical protein
MSRAMAMASARSIKKLSAYQTPGSVHERKAVSMPAMSIPSMALAGE